MDDSTSDIFNTVDESLPDDDVFGHSRDKSSEKGDGKGQDKGGWRGLSALKAQASMQDKLLEKSVPRPGDHRRSLPSPSTTTNPYVCITSRLQA